MSRPAANSQNPHMNPNDQQAIIRDWRERATCRHADPELFFPPGPAGPALAQIEEAKRICRSCPVRARCLDWALASGFDYGIWGGATEDERRAARVIALRPRSA
jgi:WhiB family redox-sensing transcriptional regulator